MKAEFTARTLTNPRLYKDFYRFYYKVAWKPFRIAGTVIGAALLVAAFAYTTVDKTVPAVILAWIGLMLIVYPRNAYRKPYRAEKGKSVEMKFRFMEDTIIEVYHGEEKTYSYQDIKKVYAGSRYIYIFTNDRQAAVLETKDIKGGTPEELKEFLRQKSGADNFKKIS